MLIEEYELFSKEPSEIIAFMQMRFNQQVRKCMKDSH